MTFKEFIDSRRADETRRVYHEYIMLMCDDPDRFAKAAAGEPNFLGIMAIVIGFGLPVPTLREQYRRFDKPKVDAATPEYLIQTGPIVSPGTRW